MSNQGFAQFIPLILIFVIFISFDKTPTKRVKEHKAMVQAIEEGDEIITSGGIIGTVDRVLEDDRIEVTLADNVKVQIIKNTNKST